MVKIEVFRPQILLLFVRVAYNIFMQLGRHNMNVLHREHVRIFMHLPSSIPQYLKINIQIKGILHVHISVLSKIKLRITVIDGSEYF